MIRLVLSSVFALHGIIHLMGFAKEWNLGPDGRFSGKTLLVLSAPAAKFVGTQWFIACILLLISTISYYTQKNWFWIPASAGLLLSQALIVLYWQDAKWGTIANVIILVAVVLSAASLRFKASSKQEVNYLISSASTDQYIITDEMITDLPPVVQVWLRNANILGKQMPSSIHIKQKGSMRTDVHADWMPFDAEQYFTIDPPGFVWTASIHTDMFIDIVGRDKYENGAGNMVIKAASLVPMANSRGYEVDQGTMVRFMAELMWFPHAAVSDYLDWEQLGDNHARVIMNHADVSASGIYTFNKDGMPIAFEAQRFGDFKGKYSKETWSVATTGYKYFDGMPIGNTSEVTWKLKDGDFTWLKLTVTDIDYK
jgi:hypothetical protein